MSEIYDSVGKVHQTSVLVNPTSGEPVGTSAGLPVSPSARNCIGRQTISVGTGAVSTLTPPAGSAAAMIQADGSAVSITLEGTDPTASTGMRIDDGVFFYVDSSLASVKMIARTAMTNVHVAYFDKA